MSAFTYPHETADPRWLAAQGGDTDMLEIQMVLVEGGWAHLRLCGELDLATADSLAGMLDEQFDSGRRLIQLDMSGLLFIDWTGLRALVRAHNECLAHRGTLVLTQVTPQAARLLKLTELTDAFFISEKVPAIRRC